MEMPVLAQVCQAARLGSGAINGTASKLKSMSYAVRCYSISGELNSCYLLAAAAGTYLDLERTGQKSFAEMAHGLDTARGGGVDQ
jgi:hypothetical protein